MIRTALILLLMIVAVPAAAGDGTTAVQEVLDRFVDAVGGREALTGRDLRHYRGTIVQDLTWHDPQHQEVPFLAEADAEGGVRYVEADTWADLEDWRDDDGVLFPHRWVFGRKGGHTTYVFEETGSGAGS